MIESIKFTNFKALRDTTLPLSQFTLLIGPNGSGKSTVLQALGIASGHNRNDLNYNNLMNVHSRESGEDITISISWDPAAKGGTYNWNLKACQSSATSKGNHPLNFKEHRVYSLNAGAIATPVRLQPVMELGSDGAGLAGVLDRLRDQDPARWEALNVELGKWLPEFDHILFDTPGTGQRSIVLRTSRGGHKIPASELSQGTLLALAMLTLAYLPDPPPVVGFEEPDRGIHPRLLRDVHDAMYRLAYPESVGESRAPVQVIATTHSPYMLDLFRDHPEEIVIAEKLDDNIQFKRLSDLPDIEEILEGAPLGDIWYSGILGGVPATK